MGAHSGLLSDVPAPSIQRSYSVSVLSAVFAAFLFAVLALLPVLFRAAYDWTHDPLRSIGVLLPIAAIVFLTRAIREFPGPWKSTLNGLWLVGVGCGIVLLHEWFAINVLLPYRIQFDPLPGGLAISFVLAGTLVLLGGWLLLRACLFPVVLAGIVNPVPHIFNEHFDLPLQVASASAARGFAHLIHEYPTGEQLRLMFTPDFGMFIAPGCNGIRGAIALALLALFAAVWLRLRPWQAAVYFLAGIATGYCFNLLRLFVLVLYYKLGQSWTAIAAWGTQVDYAIGGILFLLASFGLGSLVFRDSSVETNNRSWASGAFTSDQALWTRVCLLCLLCAVPAAANLLAFSREANRVRGVIVADRLPAQSGQYHRMLEWNEYLGGIQVYHWARYSDGMPADDLDLGIWLPPSEHDVRYSHSLRGEILHDLDPIQHDSAGIGMVTYSLYQYMEAPGSQVLLAALSCPGCGHRVIGVDHHLGPIHAIGVDPTNYFRAALPSRSVLLVHKGSAETPITLLRLPVQHFLNSFEERTLFQTNRNESQ